MTIIFITLIQFFFIPVKDRIEIKIPTVEEETEYVWRTIIDTKFFEEHNYQVSLPQGGLIDALTEKAKSNQLNDSDYESLRAFMKAGVYDKSDYQKGYNKIAANELLINKMINQLGKIKKDWPFKEFKKYQIKLTLYGPGGSYDPEAGSILIYTTKEGGFKQYDDPSNTIIHEIVHIGTESSIMNHFRVSHPLKERIIDNIVMILFQKYLPDYRIQAFGDARIDAYLKKKKDIRKLDVIVGEFLQKY